MNGSVTDARNSLPQTADDDDLWQRIRLSVVRLSDTAQRQRDPEFLASKLAARAEAYRSAPEPSRAGDSVDCLAFSISQQRYGILLNELIEIEPLEHFCPVPQTPPFIRGVIQWRGTILTLLDLSQLFQIHQQGIVDLRASLIVEAAGKQIAVAAGQAEEILTISRADIMVPSALPENVPPAWLVGLHDTNRMLLSMEQILCDERMTNWRAQRPTRR